MEKRNSIRNFIIIIVIAVLILLAAVFVWARSAAEESKASETEAIKDTVCKRALQCYVIEGAYPESLDYLIENYGLAVNLDDYRIVYKAYAENMPPDVRVVYKSKQ